ncbi:MAG: DUF4443 domain-containing protein [Promethearchaeota archaeon]
MFEELDDLFYSSTIKPIFELVHVVLALYIFSENYPEGIGRYRLRKELLIGSGTAKSLIIKLNKTINFIYVPDENIRKGHILTDKGLKFLISIKKKIPFIKDGDIKVLRDIIIESEDMNACICLTKNSGSRITNGMAQRDAAIKVNGKGATCLIFNGMKFLFETNYSLKEEENQMRINDDLQEYFLNVINEEKSNLEKNDVLIIGLGDNPEIARLACLNAALTLI